MLTVCQDRQVVEETTGTLFELIPGTGEILITFKNDGSNPITYVFQELIASTWTDMEDQGELLNDILPATGSDKLRTAKLEATGSKIRLRGSASGGSVLDFSVTRHFDRTSGGALPLLAL